MTWLFVGSSPTAPRALSMIDWHSINRVITCNAGIALVPVPDIYVLIDQVACRKHAEDSRTAAALGSRCVTLQRHRTALQNRGVEWFHEFIDLPEYGEPTASRWGCFKYSGPVCIEYAIRNGAQRVVIVGGDGYSGGREYFDDREIHNVPAWRRKRDMTDAVLVKRLDSLAQVFPRVQFEQWGQPVFRISRANWKVHPWMESLS